MNILNLLKSIYQTFIPFKLIKYIKSIINILIYIKSIINISAYKINKYTLMNRNII